MATLTIDKRSGTLYHIQWYENKQRRSISLGGSKYSRKTAETVKEIVETLLWYRHNIQIVPEKTVANWLQTAPAELLAKLAKVGLIAVHEKKTCQHLWEAFLNKKKDAKWKTLRGYLNCQTQFYETFSPTEAIETITPDRLLEWKAAMLTKLAEASTATYLKVTRTILNFAVDQKWLPDNPMRRIPIGSFVNRNKDRIISRGDYVKLLDACPNQEWRTIIALARIGGLRCPSELKQLRWTDINWEQNRFLVHSPKTEHHTNHRERIVPLFPELREELDRHFLADTSIGNTFVIQDLQGTEWNLGIPFQKIAHNAGLGTIVRPFDNMRMSRSNEVWESFGPAKENLWIGHSEATRRKHYKGELSDEAFAEAAGTMLNEQHPARAKTHAIR